MRTESPSFDFLAPNATLNPAGLRSHLQTDPVQTEGEKHKFDFLKLFMAQLKNQDPMQPQDSTQFLGQLAQFTSVESMQNLSQSFAQLSSAVTQQQAVHAGSLIGKTVEIPASSAHHERCRPGIQGQVLLPREADAVQIHIFDPQGQLIHEQEGGVTGEGTQDFAWDGTDSSGAWAPDGRYAVRAYAMFDGKREALETHLYTRITQLRFDPEKPGGVLLETDAGDPVPLSAIIRMREDPAVPPVSP